jgi:hypothetical protein
MPFRKNPLALELNVDFPQRIAVHAAHLDARRNNSNRRHPEPVPLHLFEPFQIRSIVVHHLLVPAV